MRSKNALAIVSLVALIALTGAGCKDLSKKGDKEGGFFGGNNNSEKTSGGKDTYNEAADVKFNDDMGRQVQSLVEDQFGDVKVSSYLKGFPSDESVSIGFTTKRVIVEKDMDAFLSLLKKKGYAIDVSGTNENANIISASDKTYTLFFTFENGKSEIGALIATTQSMNLNDSESESEE